MDERVTICVRGHVQNVGFAWWARRWAGQLRLTGYARETNGQVEISAQGRREALFEFMRLIDEYPTTTRRPGTVTEAVARFEQPVPDAVTFTAA